MKKRWIMIGLICLISVLNINMSVSAQTGEVVGLGHGFVALEGSGALYNNPAQVNPADDVFTLELNGQAGLWNNGFSSQNFSQHWDEEIKENILDRIDNDGLILMGQGNQDLRLILGPIGFFGGSKQHLSGTISPDLVDLILNGNEISTVENQVIYNLDGTEGDFAMYGDGGVNLSLSLNKMADVMGLNSFKIGGAYHQLYGAIARFEGKGTNEFNYNNRVKGDGSIDLRYAEEAMGFAFDLGLAVGINEKLTLGAALLNKGKIVGQDPHYSRYEYTVDGSSTEIGNFEPIVEDEPLGEDLEYILPQTVKLGLGYKWGENMDIYSDFARVSYNDGKTDSKFAVGTVFKGLKIIPVRMGASYSTLQNDFILSGGLGLHLGPLQMDLGFSDLSAFYNNAKSTDVGLSARIAF